MSQEYFLNKLPTTYPPVFPDWIFTKCKKLHSPSPTHGTKILFDEVITTSVNNTKISELTLSDFFDLASDLIPARFTQEDVDKKTIWWGLYTRISSGEVQTKEDLTEEEQNLLQTACDLFNKKYAPEAEARKTKQE